MFKCSHHVAASGVTRVTRVAAPNLTDGAAAEVVNPAFWKKITMTAMYSAKLLNIYKI